jgi:uncharacterized membrane protein YwaF
MNPVWWTLIVLVVFAAYLLWRFLKDKDEKIRRNILLAISVFNIALYFVYKFALVNYYSGEGYTTIEYIPLHLCNINVLLIPLSFIIRKRSLYAFVFFVAPLTALLALLSPAAGFVGDSIFLFKNIGYYFTHMILITTAISLVTLNIVQIKYRDVIYSTIMLFLMAAAIFAVNLIIKATFYPESNFFYTNGPYGSGGDIPALQPLWQLIHIRLVYLMPILGIVVPYELFVAAIVRKIRGYDRILHETTATNPI